VAFRAGWTATSSNEFVQSIQPFILGERARVLREIGGDAAVFTLPSEQNRYSK
jgi:hypothetical protein